MENLNDFLYSVEGSTPYRDVLPRVQEYMSRACPELFNKNTLNAEDTFLIKRNIEQYLIDNSVNCNESRSLTELTDRLYKDMVRYSFLTDYLNPARIEELGLEEINVNSWECVFIKTAKKGKLRLDEQFLSPQHARDVVSRMLRHSGMIIDDAKPVALGHIAKNIRIAAICAPVLDEEIGISCSIRVVSFSNLTRHNLVNEYETVPEEALRFLENCINYGVSICLAGATGSGKTGTAGYLLSTVPNDTRLLTVEEGSREFDLLRRGEDGRVVNDVVHLLTRPSENEKQNIDQDYLLENILRYDPEIIGVGEMRSKEAITAAEASQTDHTVITTTHCRRADGAYMRMVTLAKKASTSDDETLYGLMVDAFPIIVYQEQYRDGSRKTSEIIEGESYKDGVLKFRTLWRYIVDDNYIDENGNAKVIGKFERGEKISDDLRGRFLKKGMSRATLEQF